MFTTYFPYAVLVAWTSLTSVTGLSCMECIDARSEEDCQKRGAIRQCDDEQNSCEIEIREHEGWGGYMSIRKQCKQSDACDNDHLQNPRAAWSPTQCNTGKRNSVCRCCCSTDLCNVDKATCYGRIMCPDAQKEVYNGIVTCTNGRSPGSVCSTTCNKWTRLVGNATSYCTATGYWEQPLPQCEDLKCDKLHEVENGWYTCSRGNLVSSVCRAQCQRGFVLHGFSRIVCTVHALWSRRRPPRCIPITCPELLPVEGGITNCTDEWNVQSRCRVTCDLDRLINGVDERHCQENGQWSHDPPICQEINCRKRRKVLYGSGSCTKSIHAGSICSFSCNKGFVIKGSETSECLLNRRWSHILPVCKRIMCPPRGILSFGRVRCTSGSFTGSICRSLCNTGAILVGEAESECTLAGEWTAPLPFCDRLECSPRGTIENGFVRCTIGNFVGSRCTASCTRPWMLVGTPPSTCLESTLWSDPLPACERMVCPQRGSAKGGTVRCTDENFAGSRCTVTCDPKMKISGQAVTLCTDFGRWNAPVAECRRPHCSARTTVPAGGKVECTDEDFVGSECTVSCDSGKKLSGPPTSNCLRSQEWNTPLSSCLDIKCPDRGRIIGGEIECSKSNFAGSICRVACDVGRILVGLPASTCRDSEQWSLELPVCDRITCPPRGFVDNAAVRCSDASYLGSECSVVCSDKYELIGIPNSTCLESGEWDTELPYCKELTCEPRGTIRFGSVSCSDENNQNSVCGTTCNEGHTLVGPSDSECLFNFQWSSDLPVCEESVCQLRGEVENGVVVCNNENRPSSVCSVICDFSSRLVGIGSSECQENGEWSDPLPICELITCDDQGELAHGSITCNNENRVQSICSFNCVEKDYELYPSGRDRNVCQRNMNWNIPKPCCSRQCPPFALIDLVVVLDSSSSIGAENWIMLTSFVEGILRSFVVAPTSANFAIFRFNNVVDEENQIFLNSHPNSINALVRAFNKFEYNGSGTRTGNALNHAREVSLTRENGNRPDINDVVLVITDGAASDDVVAPSEALREMGAIVLVLGIQPPRGFLDLVQLRAIAGNDKNLLIAESGFTGLTKDFETKISRTICGEPCG